MNLRFINCFGVVLILKIRVSFSRIVSFKDWIFREIEIVRVPDFGKLGFHSALSAMCVSVSDVELSCKDWIFPKI